MKAFFAAVLWFFAAIFCCSCQPATQTDIVASLYPLYSFAQSIAGDKLSVSLLLPPSSDSHGFDPSAHDIASIHNCALFLHNGSEVEAWAAAILDSLPDSVAARNMTEGICLDAEEHDHEHDHEEHDHDHELHGDVHYWLNPQNAKIAATNVYNAIVQIDSQNTQYYAANLATLLQQIDDYEQQAWQIVKELEQPLVFAGRFAYAYFLNYFDVPYVSAYSSCDADIEPSAQEVAEVISFIKQHDIKYIFEDELGGKNIATMIAEQTGAQILLFHTAHNVSKQQLQEGVGFVDIMNQNLQSLLQVAG